MAANTNLIQQPFGKMGGVISANTALPVGQPLMFVVDNNQTVMNETKVKFVAEVFISTGMINTALTEDLIGTFKTTPNAEGKGMFDFSNLIDSYVKADQLASTRGSTFKGIKTTTYNNRHPLHLVDKFSLNNNCLRYMIIVFHTEALDTTLIPPSVAIVAGSEKKSTSYSIFNGYLKSTDPLIASSFYGGFGYDMSQFLLDGTDKKFLTNAPTTQYANIDDYGTVAILSKFNYNVNFNRMRFDYYDSDGVLLDEELVTKSTSNGAWTNYSHKSTEDILYFGCYPANLRNWSSVFQNLVTTGSIDCGRIDVTAYSQITPISSTYTIHINPPDGRGYESIRLTWLNQWGVWDYYTFTKKSVKTISTKGVTYDQLGGTWNKHFYCADGFSGGKKAFRMNATEKIKMNTDFVTENDTVMFEELTNSPEVYILGTFNADDTAGLILNTYVTPARITTSSFTRKTVANDKLMQYTFEVEKSKTLRTQSV
tara:strand:+ start:1686 stop:3134 length:1449 start_codon:yes stop_codon:yes gene_type:complete